MGFEEVENYNEGSATPKLCLHNTSFASNKKLEPIGMVTPPLKSLASVPFKWEEAPGKPRTTVDDGGVRDRRSSPLVSKSKAVRCLVPPPPRLSGNTSKTTNIPSPTTVLDGPYVYRLSESRSFSSRSKGSFRSFYEQEKLVVEGSRDGKGENFTSWRWGSNYKESSSRRGGVEGSMDFSTGVGGSGVENCTKVGITRRIRRRSSFFLNLSSTSSNVLSSMYENFKQAVQRKRGSEKTRKMSSS